MATMFLPLTEVLPFRKTYLHLELMLGKIANFCPIISRSSIVKNSTSISSVWQAIRAHYGFQSTGARFLDLFNIKLEVDERPEDLFQHLEMLDRCNITYLLPTAL